jgi:hypothetical protein
VEGDIRFPCRAIKIDLESDSIWKEVLFEVWMYCRAVTIATASAVKILHWAGIL